MKKFNQTEKLANKQRHPKKPIKYYTVEVPGRGVVYENNSQRLAMQYITDNNLNPKQHLKTVR